MPSKKLQKLTDKYDKAATKVEIAKEKRDAAAKKLKPVWKKEIG